MSSRPRSSLTRVQKNMNWLAFVLVVNLFYHPVVINRTFPSMLSAVQEIDGQKFDTKRQQ